MVDGVSGTDLMAVLLDRSPDATVVEPAPWEPRPAPSDTQLTVDALADLAMIPLRGARMLAAAMMTPGRSARQVSGLVAGLRSFSKLAPPAPALSIEGAIGPHRRYAAARARLADVTAIRRSLGGSVNDVVLSVIAGAFRDVLIGRGESVEGVSLRSLVPVSVRSEDDRSPNNQVSMVIAELPVGEEDPRQRLEAVRRQMSELKSSHQIDVGTALVASAEFAPPLIQALGIRGAMAILRRAPQRNINTVTTNVPGPQYPLFALGREMIDYLGYVPLSPGVRIGVAILSYNGQLSFGITGDYDTAPDVHFMAQRIEAAIEQLRKVAKRT
jgi:diacylglycerol O-acyltransferase